MRELTQEEKDVIYYENFKMALEQIPKEILIEEIMRLAPDVKNNIMVRAILGVKYLVKFAKDGSDDKRSALKILGCVQSLCSFKDHTIVTDRMFGGGYITPGADVVVVRSGCLDGDQSEK